MSADLLRRAATKLREHAKDASIGPWVAAEDGLVWPPRLGDPVSGPSAIEDANYIALLHPPVGELIAAWLTVVAMDEEDYGASDLKSPARARELSTATMIARAILREDIDVR